MNDADATTTLTIRIPTFMVDALDTIVSTSRPAAPSFRAPTRADLVRRALGEFITSRDVPADPPALATRPRVTAYPSRRAAR